jgi:hypothetical protein
MIGEATTNFKINFLVVAIDYDFTFDIASR